MRLLLAAALLVVAASVHAKKKPAAPAAEQAAASGDAGTADADQRQLAVLVLTEETSALDPALASAFMKLDVETLPKKLRLKARAKQLELNALVKVSEGKKKGGIRMVDAAGCTPPNPTPDMIPFMLGIGGFVEVQEVPTADAEVQTECTELDMQCQFSLHIVRFPKGSKPPRRLFIQEKDPMALIIAMKDKNMQARQTNFFGTGFLKCQH
jgi:hypothetical protein